MAESPTGWRRVVLGSHRPADALEASSAPRPEMTTIDPGCEIEGTLTLDRSITIEGEFRGAIRCAETVTIGSHAAVEADIEARTIEVRGAVKGNLKANREIVLHPGSKLHGDVDAPSLVIERGAFFQGETRMFRPEAGLRTTVEPATADA